ncbi:ATP-dependent zinc metalloprotease FtsH [Naasia sp. SYSU D00057]|uniref:ATP-dependent zinc metalloprotease FtsH n=1 Tax=Naasia sp. SYSU D00057 TaxID=2817380 RepID=UPI0027DE13EE|nr:ATP-dependent zinc metalloprotease FtsH [Naasia sp. SYSU D00057]
MSSDTSSGERRPPEGREGEQPDPQGRPWRTEGLQPTKETPPKRPNWWLTALWVGLAYFLTFGLFTAQDTMAGAPAVPYTEFTRQVERNNVEEVFSRGDSIQGVLRNEAPLPGDSGGTYSSFTTERPTFAQDDLLAELAANGSTVRATPVLQERGLFWNLLLSLGPILLLIGFYWWMLRRQQGMGALFGGGGRRKPVDPESVRVTFGDVAGIDEVEAEIAEVVDFLKDPDKYRRLGARAPKGILLAGPPGTGKTLLARATAGEAGVPFFSASASEFIEMIVGVGASRVRELFGEARKVAPAIIFIDEIDTIGRARGGARAVGGHDEREQTLNQILTEMDGFSGSEGVVVLAATNRPDVLDPALLRPGRFDRTITVHAPDQRGREQILAVHTRGKPLGRDVDLGRLASATPGMTGAELANLVNEAAFAAARRGQPQILQRDLLDALEKIQLGTARTIVMPEEERRRTAYHEAGHALLGILQPGADPVRKVSIIPRGRALGVTLSTPDTDRYGYEASYLRGRIIGALGGMAAEAEVLKAVTTGAENDLETATGVARGMVGRWGMSETVGPVSVLPREGDPRAAGVSDLMLAKVDEEVRRLIEECYVDARRLIREHRSQLDAIAAALLERETLDEIDVYAAAGVPRRSGPEHQTVHG